MSDNTKIFCVFLCSLDMLHVPNILLIVPTLAAAHGHQTCLVLCLFELARVM